MRNGAGQSVGLVLSGGGARGAYEVGVTKYLAEAGIEPDLFAGASVGALNAAFLAASDSIEAGATRLEGIWRSLSKDKMIKANPKLIGMGLVYSGLKAFIGARTMMGFHHQLLNKIALDSSTSNYLGMLLRSPLRPAVEKGILDNGSLKSLLEDHISNDLLDNGKPLWISLYESNGTVLDLLEFVGATLRIKNNRSSDYIHLQSLSVEDRINALLASAALPLAYDSQQINGKTYRDGGLGEAKMSKGNTPLEPLVNAGCTHAIVVHLKHGSFWDRKEYENTSIIEVRPAEDLYAEGKLSSLMNFDENKINYLIERGYEDAYRCIGNVLKAIKLQEYTETTRIEMRESLIRLQNDSFEEWVGKL